MNAPRKPSLLRFAVLAAAAAAVAATLGLGTGGASAEGQSDLLRSLQLAQFQQRQLPGVFDFNQPLPQVVPPAQVPCRAGHVRNSLGECVRAPVPGGDNPAGNPGGNPGNNPNPTPGGDVVIVPEPPRPTTPDCRGALVWSPELNRCIERPPVVVIDPFPPPPRCFGNQIFSPPLNRCIDPPVIGDPQLPACPAPLVWSTTQGRCVERPVVVQPTPPRPPSGPTIDVVRVQTCLNRLGFDAGTVDGAIGPRTRAAFRGFQTSNGLADRPNAITDQTSLTRLFQLCETQVAVAPTPPLTPIPPVTPIPTAAPRCVDPDLFDMLVTEYGPRPGVERCIAACLPKPAFMSEADLTAIAIRDGVTWCGACIQLGSYLPLRAVLEIERAANITLCAAPPLACYVPGTVISPTRTEVRTIYRDLPFSVGNDADIAVIIGNESYSGDLPPNLNGLSDADAVHALLVNQLGYKEENVIDLRNASLADLRRVFGDSNFLPDGRTREQAGLAPPAAGELAARLGENAEDRDVFIYVSSHGIASDGAEHLPYLLPVDARTDQLAGTALSLGELYDSLGRLGTRTTMLVLEASFAPSLVELINPPNLPSLEVSIDPATPVPGLAVFKASDRDQRTLQDPEYGIGLFTRYLIEGLAGAADSAPIGNGDKRIDTVELFVYTADMVRTAARKSFGLEQKPLLARVDNVVIGQLASLQ